MLFEELNNIHLSDIYNAWENNYNDTKMCIEDLENYIHYNDIIKPRISKYRELKRNYDDWVKYDSNKKIIDAYHYNRLKRLIEINDLYKEYQSNEEIKPQIKEKLELKDLIASRTEDIKNLNDKVVKYTTINTYNNENKTNYNSLLDIDKELENIIDVLDTILINFQSFRKELYDNLILTKLVDKTNKIIRTLCHSNTKPFKLNYNVDISNDTVHINWLIHNDNISRGSKGNNDNDDKQYISVSQASGFQRFVISLALRMSLYFNNYDVLCNQLFIDEGFINFDKNNLSVVPLFLKSLLHYFNTIVILSHIDIIQDSVDETAVISFNNINGVSSLVYS
jgi:DNA repair exonuclease SbcCD ATPase subunit